MYSRSYSMRTGKDRVQLEATQVVITIGDARIEPGDIVRGDSDGVIAIPNGLEDKVLDVAEAIEVAEHNIRAAVLSGKRLDEARREQQYHMLQRREQV
jgi:regulator of RNase E activity RraA